MATMTSAAEKQEVTGCDASIMKDVWEIRLREYGQKQHNEQERVDKSALETINQEWQKRMTSKEKYPKRLVRKPKPVDEDEYFREPGHLGSQSQRPKMAVSKGQLQRKTLQRLISLTSAQPSFMVWAKSWRFSRSKPQQKEGAAPPSNWGKSWQFMTRQPHIEGKTWPQHNGPKPNQDTYSLYERPAKMMDPQHFQHGLPVPEWEKSWKYTKSDIKQKLETEAVSMGNQDQEDRAQYSKTRMLDMLVESSSEWKKSWKSTKPPKDGESPIKKSDNGPMDDFKTDGKTASQFPESWRFINKQLHLNGKPNQTFNNFEWAGSWRAATTVSINNKREKSHGPVVYGELEPQGPQHHDIIMFVSREHKYRELWSLQMCDENNLMSGWDQSWETTKNLSGPSSEATKAEKPDETPKESEKFEVKVPSKKVEKTGVVQSIMPQKTIVSKLSKSTKLMSPLLIPALPCEWEEAWKFPKPQSSKEIMRVGNGIPDASMVLKQHLKNWSESYKCARAYHVKPSGPEWKESWLSRYQPNAGREYSVQQPKHDIFNPSKRTTADKMLHHVKHMEKGQLTTEWAESWKCLNHQMRMEHMRTRLHRSRPFRGPVTEERPSTEWGNSWRSTSHNLNQESDLWQQGWSNMPPARPDRAIDQHHFMVQEVPSNGPTGTRRNTSWRFSRQRMEVQQPGRHRMEAEQPGPSTRVDRLPPRGGRTVGDWEESWMVSNGQYHHDRPSMTDWTESWRWSVFHTDRWGEEQPKQNWHDKSLDIIPSREKWRKTAMTKISRSFDSQLLKDLQYAQFSESWMAATPQRHHYKPLSVLDKSKSRCFHLKNSKASMKEWTDSWKFVYIHFSQRKEAWAEIRVANTMTHGSEYQVNYDDYNNSNAVSKWEKSWKIYNPVAHTEKGSSLDCDDNQSQYQTLWSRAKSMNHLYANLHKETAMLRLWGKSWRFWKKERKADSKSGKSKYKESKGGLELMEKRIKTRKHIYCQIEKDTPSERRWLDSHKVMKTQPRPRRDAWLNMPQMETKEEEGFTQQWEGSWRFSNQPQKKEAVKACLKTWGDSWKFLIPPNPAQNGSRSM